MRVGTWNLDARWSDRHRALLEQNNCDVWLVTEISPKLVLDGHGLHLSESRMTRGQHYAGILSRLPISALHDPHPASAMAKVGGITFCSSILPWAGCGTYAESPWVRGMRLHEQMASTVDALGSRLPKSDLVWGGDWNQNLHGSWQNVGCSGGRAKLEEALGQLGLTVPTKALPHRIANSFTIDHIAVPGSVDVIRAERIDASGLSDHDAYVVEVEMDTSVLRQPR